MYIKSMMNVDQISAEALNLPYKEKGLLVDRLIESMGREIDPEITKIHRDVALRRLREVEDGSVELLSSDDVFHEARTILNDK